MASTELYKRGGDASKLTDKQRKFVAEYMVDYNGQRAASVAGYKNPNVLAAQLVNHPIIKRIIGKIQHEDIEKLQLNKEEILKQLYYNVTRDPIDLVDAKGNFFTNINDINPRMRACIDGFKVKQFTDYETGNVTQEIEVKMTSKLSAIDLAMKHKGLFAVVKEEHTHVVIDWSKMTEPLEDGKNMVIEAQLKALENKDA